MDLGLGGKTAPQVERRCPLIGLQFIENGLVVARLDDDGDIVVIFGRGADHRGPADVDVLDALLEIGAFVDGGFERIEVDDQKIDLRDAVGLHRADVVGFAADGSWRTFGLRKDFFPATKIQVEDDITASVVVPPGVLFMPFHFCEGPANALTQDALDPVAKIPEYKVCAAQIRAVP